MIFEHETRATLEHKFWQGCLKIKHVAKEIEKNYSLSVDYEKQTTTMRIAYYDHSDKSCEYSFKI